MQLSQIRSRRGPGLDLLALVLLRDAVAITARTRVGRRDASATTASPSGMARRRVESMRRNSSSTPTWRRVSRVTITVCPASTWAVRADRLAKLSPNRADVASEVLPAEPNRSRRVGIPLIHRQRVPWA